MARRVESARRRIAIGIAAAAVACGLGIAAAVGPAQAGPTPEAPASGTEAQPAQSAGEADEGMTVADVEAPDGTEIVAPGDAEGTGEAVDAEGAGDDGAVNPSGGDSSAGATQSGEAPSGPASSGTASSAQSSPAATPSGSTPSGQTSSDGSPSGSQQAHTHDWEPVYQSVWVQDSAAWDEPTYSTVTKIRCSTCGALFDTVDECIVHGDVHGDDFSYSSVAVKVQTGTKHHDATGHYEQRVTGYRCATCGATK